MSKVLINYICYGSKHSAFNNTIKKSSYLQSDEFLFCWINSYFTATHYVDF